MLDKSIPYFNLLMVREKQTKIPKVVLPDGYSFSFYTQGDENTWAEITSSIGEFDSFEKALDYFRKKYIPYLDELKRRLIFIKNSDGRNVATFTCWWDYNNKRRLPSLHWIAVKKEFLGLGLGEAVVFQGLRYMIQIEGDIDFFLHTQSWSYKAIGIYLKSGFSFIKNESIWGYKNEYYDALPLLKEKVRIRQTIV